MVIYSRVRTSDGLTLYAVSSDGTMAVFSFDPDELEGISPLSAQEQYLKKFGFTIPPLPDGFSHQPKQADTDTRMTPPPSPVRAQSVAAPSQDLGFGSSSNGGEHVNKLVAKRNTKKKRIQPTFMGTLTGPQEYKHALILYAKKIADEGFRAKAEELVKELFGPVYWRPGRDDSWSPITLGFSKRDLLKDVLAVFARSKTLTKLALDWQDILKKASNEEY
ncbi:hypothetical protein EW026_g6424 [Hermanssonia centrifuga]|uniref:Protein HIRA-like C-terminal domain-containing protein n=1 Tax=Hermanssonia centrifuga TaxID=98765 RepID=A0A4S4KB45_9APHY|nr:hypothetical protein EW026_g6424 [Hermanssonia centrifuga]